MRDQACSSNCSVQWEPLYVLEPGRHDGQRTTVLAPSRDSFHTNGRRSQPVQLPNLVGAVSMSLHSVHRSHPSVALLLSMFLLLETVSRAQSQSPAEHQKLLDSTLISVAEKGYLDSVEIAIKAGANVNAVGDDGETALRYAVANGHTDVVLALIKAGAKLVNDDRQSLLMLAVWNCHADTVLALIDAGAKLSPTDWRKDRPPQFSDFPARHIYHGKSAAVDWSSNPKARTYRTRLKEAASCSPDFAGHYIVTQWGCGSNCQDINFINARNGAVIDGVDADRGADFRLDSELFIENPAQGGDELAYEDDPVDSLGVDYFVMRNSKLELIYSQACKVVDHRQRCGCEDLQKLASQTVSK